MVYATVYFNLNDPDKFEAYRSQAGTALAKHGGKVEASAKGPTVLDTALPGPSVAAVLSFPTREAALAWHADPELQDVHALRNGAGESSILLVG